MNKENKLLMLSTLFKMRNQTSWRKTSQRCVTFPGACSSNVSTKRHTCDTPASRRPKCICSAEAHPTQSVGRAVEVFLLNQVLFHFHFLEGRCSELIFLIIKFHRSAQTCPSFDQIQVALKPLDRPVHFWFSKTQDSKSCVCRYKSQSFRKTQQHAPR